MMLLKKLLKAIKPKTKVYVVKTVFTGNRWAVVYKHPFSEPFIHSLHLTEQEAQQAADALKNYYEKRSK